ncbi:T6SS phospholipase effector Tle1-like catalytic domain-containing protein [Agarilytica rhodophyticola]|uniref:phospholipase effector Tle1 domain-containing protein n=1 Tax=Agarilytica rhodophyticola TaxID=1737490 RepID=UPI000B344117|nr:DUF2235 domain-containing protein [Agarilytica rhodophyticola]
MTDIGESVHAPQPPEEPERPEDDLKSKIKVRFSVFFDGTLNNRDNTGAREKNTAAYRNNKKSDSYGNDYSNVAKMERYVEEQADGYDFAFSTYVEGIGTQNFGSDKNIGYALGQGSTGVEAKVRIGITRVLNKMQEEIEDKGIIEKLTLDVFGFSRGAAAARNFIHQALSTQSSYIATGYGGMVEVPARPLKRRLVSAGFEDVELVEVHFAGLYDTVASHGLSHSNDTETLHLDSIAKYKAKKVLQLAAAEEYRANFSLTNVNSTGGKQVFLPGVHSDIGGGYRDGHGEDLVIRESHSEAELNRDRADLMAQGWYHDQEITVVKPFISTMSMGYGYMAPPIPGKITVTRQSISNHYSRIPLRIMARFARENGINILPDLEDENAITGAFLNQVYQRLDAYANGGSKKQDWFHNAPWLRQLRHDYLHFSAQLETTWGVAAHKPNLVNGRRERVEHYG